MCLGMWDGFLRFLLDLEWISVFLFGFAMDGYVFYEFNGFPFAFGGV